MPSTACVCCEVVWPDGFCSLAGGCDMCFLPVAPLSCVCRPYVTTFPSLARLMASLRDADFDATSCLAALPDVVVLPTVSVTRAQAG